MNETGNRLSAALLGYFILIILLLTLNPFYLAIPENVSFTFQSDLNNLVSNILLFLPVGFFYKLSTGKRGALLAGAIFSTSIELIQLFIPARTPSVIDILANTVGAGLGAVLYDIISSQIAISQGTIGRLRLETPLMGIIYLLTPLLWVNTFHLEYSPSRKLLTALLGLCGTIILSELFRHWWEKISYRIVGYASLAAGLWFTLGIFPAIRTIRSIVGLGAGIILLTALLTAIPQHAKDRRFEHGTLKKVFPIFVLYLLLLAIWNPGSTLTTWHWSLGFTNRITETSMEALFPRIEYLVAFSVLGYMLAEWRGRSEIPLAQDLPRLSLNAMGIAVTLEMLVGFQSGPGTSLIRAVMSIFSALLGGTIYHLLRAHIRYLLSR